MASRYYIVNYRDNNFNVDIKGVKLCLWDLSLSQTKIDYYKSLARTDLPAAWNSEFVTSKGFFNPCLGRTVSSGNTLTYDLWKNTPYFVDNVFANAENGYFYLDNGKEMRYLFSGHSCTLAFFVNDDFTSGEAWGLGYTPGNFPGYVEDSGVKWYFDVDTNNRRIKAATLSNLKLFLDGLEPHPMDESENPYDPGGSSETGGGGGSFDNTSTPIDIPNLPSISAASTGFISLFNPSLSELNDLASYMWSDLFQIDGWKKLFADPMDAILGLSIVPVAVPSGGKREVKVGNIGTGKELTLASSQFVKVDCGSIDVNEYWGAYLDYEPYTQAQIFLPYIGTRPISVDDIMGKTVRVVYHVDILTGACCCFVKCGDSVLYTYNGQCSIPIPITGANYASVVNGVINIAASVGSLVATGGSSAPTAISAIATSAVNQMKPQVEKSGSISGSAGVLNMQTPYLILIRPRQALPSKQNEFIGYPSLITVQLTELKGYTEVQSIHLDNIPATQEELAEIESLLKGGVIF